MRRLLGYTAVVLGTLVALYVLWQFRLVVLLFALSLFVAAAVRPIIERLVERGLPRPVSLVLVYLVGIGSLVGTLALAGEPLLNELNILANRAVIVMENLYRTWEDGSAWQQALAERLVPLFEMPEESNGLQTMLPAVVGLTQGLVGALGGLLLVLVASIYWSVDQHYFERLWLSLLPAGRRTYARNSWREIEEVVGAYLRSQIVQSILIALFLALGAYLLNLEFPILLSLFGALAAFVPLFGGAITAVVAYLVGSLNGFPVALAAGTYALFLSLGLDLAIEPRLLARRRSLLLTVLLLLPLVESYGLAGLIIAPPVASMLEVVISQLFRAQVNRRDRTVQLQELQQRYQTLKERVNGEADGEVPPELVSIMERLGELLQQSQRIGRQ